MYCRANIMKFIDHKKLCVSSFVSCYKLGNRMKNLRIPPVLGAPYLGKPVKKFSNKCAEEHWEKLQQLAINHSFGNIYT